MRLDDNQMGKDSVDSVGQFADLEFPAGGLRAKHKGDDVAGRIHNKKP